MELKQAEQIYATHVKRTEQLLDSLDKDPQAINAAITHTYANLYQQHPTF